MLSLDDLPHLLYSSFSLLLAVAAVYAVYYLKFVVKTPRLYCGSERYIFFLQQHLPDLSRPFYPTFWCYGELLQCLFGSYCRQLHKLPYQREMIKTPDGGLLVLSWLRPQQETPEHPTVILLPGLTGSCEDGYMLNLAKQVNSLNYRAVVFNNRGNGVGAQVKTPRTYNARNTEDLELVIKTVSKHCPGAPLLAVGVSLGGLILTHYITSSKRCPLRAALVISTAWDVFQSAASLELPLYRAINYRLARNLVAKFEQHMHLFENVDHQRIRRSRTIREFDHHFTSKVFGYAGHEEYYRDACIHKKLKDLKIPLLVLQAADDPFCPEHSLPLTDFSQCSHAALILTKHGGHVGFLDSLLPGRSSLMDRVLKDFARAVFTQALAETHTRD